MIDDDDGRGREAAGGDHLANSGGDDGRDGSTGGEPIGKRERERRGLALKIFQIGAECGADGTLGANEEGDEDEVTFASGDLGADEGLQRDRGGAVEFGGREAVAVFP